MHFCKDVPKVLVGMKSDLRHDPQTIGELMMTNQKPVTIEEVSEKPTAQQLDGSLNATIGYTSSQKK